MTFFLVFNRCSIQLCVRVSDGFTFFFITATVSISRLSEIRKKGSKKETRYANLIVITPTTRQRLTKKTLKKKKTFINRPLSLPSPHSPLILSFPPIDTQWAYWAGIRNFYEAKKVNNQSSPCVYFPSHATFFFLFLSCLAISPFGFFEQCALGQNMDTCTQGQMQLVVTAHPILPPSLIHIHIHIHPSFAVACIMVRIFCS